MTTLTCHVCGERPAEEFEPTTVTLASLIEPSQPRYVLVRHRRCKEGWTGYLPEAEALALRQRLDKEKAG